MKSWGEGHWGWANPCWEIWGHTSLEGSGWWRRSWNSPRWLSLLYSELLPKGLWFLGFHGGTSLEPCWVFLTYSMSRELRFLPCLNPPFLSSAAPAAGWPRFCQTGPGYKLLANCYFSPVWFAGVVGSYIFNLTWKTVQRQTVLCDMKVLWISKLLIIFSLILWGWVH